MPDPLFQSRELVYVVEPLEHGLRLDAFLVRHMPWRSRTSIQALIHEGEIALVRRGERSVARKPSAAVVDADRVLVTLPKPKRQIDFEEGRLDPAVHLPVLYEDRWLLAVDKPPDVAVHPAGRNLYRTVIGELHRVYRRPDDPESDVVPKLCHRLDLETSGVLLVAKDDAAHRHVSAMFREREAEKEYLAVVEGVPSPRAGTIELPIGPALASAVGLKQGVRPDVGLPAKTGYEVLEDRGGLALLRVRLYTGRHHQIRVHLAAIGHPIVGDKIYGADEERFIRYQEECLTPEDWQALRSKRHALHAHRLRIRHPMQDGFLEIESPLPADLRALLDG